MPSSDPLTEASLVTWYDRQVESESVALQRLWDAYFHRMVPLARRRMLGSKREVRDEEDIALSAFQSFCRGLQRGRFVANRADDETSDDDNLWPLLVTITLNKATEEIRRQRRLKRGGEFKNVAVGSAIELLDQLADSGPDPHLVATAQESLQRLMSLLDESGNRDLRDIVVASFEGESPEQIAQRFECSLRTVQRKLKTARALWESDSQ
ncbi:MAG: ECF-type sigma factor [Planctomycetota bacterium]